MTDTLRVLWAFLVRDYVLLRSGGALGRGCGPLVVAREAIGRGDLAGRHIAIPGRNTTGNTGGET